jgi:hypothetical protein
MNTCYSIRATSYYTLYLVLHVRMDYLRRLAYILIFGLLTAYLAIFYLDLDNVWVSIYLRLISLGLIPLTVCFSWLYLWRNESEPFRFLSQYNSISQGLFIILNVIRVPITKLGFFGIIYISLSIILIITYLTDWAYSKRGFFIIGGLILLNVVFAFGLVMTTFEQVHPFFLNSGPSLMALSDFITEISIMGALLAASSQLYWHEILKKRREQEAIERIFSMLDAED